MIELFTDGGVIGHNPSKVGGTWAWAVVIHGSLQYSHSGIVTPAELQVEQVTNNQTELLAVVKGLQALRLDEPVTVYSDSQVTLLRLFGRYKWNNIPSGLALLAKDLLSSRAEEGAKTEHVLLAGHPTKEELLAGIGKRGHPVSQWNVYCDRLCQESAREYLGEKSDVN